MPLIFVSLNIKKMESMKMINNAGLKSRLKQLIILVVIILVGMAISKLVKG